MHNLIQSKIRNDHYKTIVENGTHILISDEPLDNGGQNLGFSPSELFSAALGVCTAMTLRMYTDRKGIRLTGVDAQVSYVTDPITHKTVVTRLIKLEGDLSEEEKTRILEIANKCNIHKLLTHEIEVDSKLVEIL